MTSKYNLKCFGVGDGWPSAQFNHSSYLYSFPEAALLIDCGEPISRNFKASGLSYDTFDRIFLSHLHFDHVGGFFMLMQGLWLERRTRELVVHAPQDGIAPIRHMLDAACIFQELLPFALRFETLKHGVATPVNGVRVTPFLTTHLDGFKRSFQQRYPGNYAAFSFLFESAGCRVGHSADIGAVEDLAPLVEKPLDLLVCEMAHVPPEALFDFLAPRTIQRVAFVHLAREHRQNFSGIQARARERLTSMDVVFPNDTEELAG